MCVNQKDIGFTSCFIDVCQKHITTIQEDRTNKHLISFMAFVAFIACAGAADARLACFMAFVTFTALTIVENL